MTRFPVSAGCDFVRVPTQPLPLLSHWHTRISFPGGQWVMALKDPSFGHVIKELEKWNKWKRILTEHKLPCSRLSLTPGEVHGSSWLHPGRKGVCPQYVRWSMRKWSSACSSCWRKQTRHHWTGLPRTVGFYMCSARSFITAADADCFQQGGKEIKSRWKRPFCLAGG